MKKSKNEKINVEIKMTITVKKLEEYTKTFMERPYENIWGVKDNKDGTIIIYSTWDTKHPECPIKVLNVISTIDDI